jgi:hypothetical protein
MSKVTYRWLDGPTLTDAEWAKEMERIDPVLATRGWASLNKNMTRILIAEDESGKMAFHVFQMVGFCGPLFLPPSMRGTGVAEELADKMFQFLGEMRARGWIAIANSPHAAVLCEKYGMDKLTTPVYVMPNPGGLSG